MGTTSADDVLQPPEVDEKWAGATRAELADYVASSHIKPNETEDVHRARVADEERALLARIAERTKATPAAEATGEDRRGW